MSPRPWTRRGRCTQADGICFMRQAGQSRYWWRRGWTTIFQAVAARMMYAAKLALDYRSDVFWRRRRNMVRPNPACSANQRPLSPQEKCRGRVAAPWLFFCKQPHAQWPTKPRMDPWRNARSFMPAMVGAPRPPPPGQEYLRRLE